MIVDSGQQPVRGWLRLLAWLLVMWEPVTFAIVAAGAMNALQVRGLSVGLVLLARLLAVASCVAAGRALLDMRPAGVTLARVALVAAAAVQLFAYLTPYFPSNRLPGETPLYVAVTVAYYGGWLAYLARSKRVAERFG